MDKSGFKQVQFLTAIEQRVCHILLKLVSMKLTAMSMIETAKTSSIACHVFKFY